jgi:hypothetical protein
MIGCPDTSVRNYQSTLRKIPEEHGSHLCHSGSLKSCISEEHTATIMTVFLKFDRWWNAVCSSETLVPIYQARWYYYPMGNSMGPGITVLNKYKHLMYTIFLRIVALMLFSIFTLEGDLFDMSVCLLFLRPIDRGCHVWYVMFAWLCILRLSSSGMLFHVLIDGC